MVLGGLIGAYDETIHPFLLDELKILDVRLSVGLPTLGICLGAQLIARALAKLYAGHGKEIGWSPLSLTQEGLNSPIRHLARSKTSMFHWHGDTFNLPVGARLLTSTD